MLETGKEYTVTLDGNRRSFSQETIHRLFTEMSSYAETGLPKGGFYERKDGVVWVSYDDIKDLAFIETGSITK